MSDAHIPIFKVRPVKVDSHQHYIQHKFVESDALIEVLQRIAVSLEQIVNKQ